MAAPLFAVSLVDARTGRPHRVGGAVMTLFTRNPDEAAQDLLRNRDPRHWRIEARAFAPAAFV
jgi:hypothetical protein